MQDEYTHVVYARRVHMGCMQGETVNNSTMRLLSEVLVHSLLVIWLNTSDQHMGAALIRLLGLIQTRQSVVNTVPLVRAHCFEMDSIEVRNP